MKNINLNLGAGYGDRVQRLARFGPLFKLQEKRIKDRQGTDIDMFGIGLLTLLFFFENMLLRNHAVGAKELALFLSERLSSFALMPTDVDKITKIVIETFRPPTGKRNVMHYYHWAEEKTKEVQFTLLKAAGFDKESMRQFYTLDNDGLELIFATREYYAEFSLSINQLLLRKQLEKGQFVSALRQIDEMRIDVVNLGERIKKMKHDIQRSIVSDETYGRFKTVVEDLNQRMEREDLEFKELQSFVKQTKARLAHEDKVGQEKVAYEQILEVAHHLNQVHYLHTALLKKSIDLKTTALKSAQDSLYFVGLDRFNFKEQLTAKVFSAPVPLGRLRLLTEPFLYVETYQTWSPLSVFEKQRYIKEDEAENQGRFPQIADVSLKEKDKKIMIHFYQEIVTFLKVQFSLREKEGHITLSELILEAQKEHDPWFRPPFARLFFEFFLLLHYYGPIDFENVTTVFEEEDAQVSSLIFSSLALLAKDYEKLEILLSKTSIAHKHFCISDMVFSWTPSLKKYS